MAEKSALELFLRGAGAGGGTEQERAYGELLRFVRIVVRAEMGRRLRDHRESADVCQSIARSFVDDFRAGRLHFETEQALAAYLRLAVRNKLAELSRRDTALKRGGGRARAGDEASLAAADDDPAPTPDELARLRARMTDEERRLADLRLRGLGWDTVGAELGLSAQTARQRFSRMLRRLRETG